eukprot:TRINITY_DN9318_c0_g2_i6.p1 TRINITY_DN9318_c0_g2~~TRINITY_DN9318_c0_g2_i6.p1  ORF type:complete len:100 (-),score=20.60 TRINITY_DN9318_c0_g2_i6:78-377(-)
MCIRDSADSKRALPILRYGLANSSFFFGSFILNNLFELLRDDIPSHFLIDHGLKSGLLGILFCLHYISAAPLPNLFCAATFCFGSYYTSLINRAVEDIL